MNRELNDYGSDNIHFTSPIFNTGTRGMAHYMSRTEASERECGGLRTILNFINLYSKSWRSAYLVRNICIHSYIALWWLPSVCWMMAPRLPTLIQTWRVIVSVTATQIHTQHDKMNNRIAKEGEEEWLQTVLLLLNNSNTRRPKIHSWAVVYSR